MVYINFPQHYTEEEEMLQKKYAKLKKKKKALAALRAPKPEPPPQEIDLKGKKRNAEAAADATEQAKKLIKSGAIKVGGDKKDSQSFKRTKRQKEPEKSFVGFTPFSPTHTSSSSVPPPSRTPEVEEDKGPTEGSSRPRVRGIYDSFVRESRYERREREPPKKGNTIYVFGHGLSEETLKKAFSHIGNIVHINMEKEKNCGFVTFEKMESADQAISEMNSSMVGEVQLKVSMAIRQPNFETLSDPSSNSWGSIAANSSQKSSHKDKRDLVTYEEDIF